MMTLSVCVCVCLSARISPEWHVWSLPVFCGCCLWPWLGPPLAEWRNPRGGPISRVFFLINNALYIVHAFGTHIKMAEPIEMPFGMMTGLDPRNNVLRGNDDPQRGMGNFGENVPDKPNTLWIAKWTGPCSSSHTTQADAWLQTFDESIIGREKRNCTQQAKSHIYDCLVFAFFDFLGFLLEHGFDHWSKE